MTNLERERAIQKELENTHYMKDFYKSLSLLYKEALYAIPNHTTLSQVSVLAGGNAAHLDALVLLSMLPNQQITIDTSDNSYTRLDLSIKTWNMLLQESDKARRDLRQSLIHSTVHFRIADATDPKSFIQNNDLTILRNPGGIDVFTGQQVDKTKLFQTMSTITKSGGFIMATTLQDQEISEHVHLMKKLPVKILIDKQRSPTYIQNFPLDTHLLVAQKR